MSPTLSVIVPSYNHARYIGQTLASIESQSFQDFELIVVDDKSTDGSLELIQALGTRAQVMVQPNQGAVAARNRGIRLAQGEYICFVDSDDYLVSNRFETQIALMKRDPALGLVFADAWIVDEAGKTMGRFHEVYPVIPGPVADMLLLHYCFIPMSTAMVRRHYFNRVGLFEAPFLISDYLKWIEIAGISATHYDPAPLAYWRRHPTSSTKTTNQAALYRDTRESLQKLLLKYPHLGERVGKKMHKRYARSFFLTAFFAAADGDIALARDYYKKALRQDPRSIVNWGGLLLASQPWSSLAIALHRYVKAKKLPW